MMGGREGGRGIEVTCLLLPIPFLSPCGSGVYHNIAANIATSSALGHNVT